MPEQRASPSRSQIARGTDRFRVVMTAIVPEAATMDDAAWREADGIIQRALSSRSAGVRRQIGMFLLFIDAIAFVRHGRGLADLPLRERERLLESFAKSR